MSRPLLPNDPPAPDDPGEPLILRSERGDIVCRYHRGLPGNGAVILIGGTDAGLQGPADWIYPTLSDDLATRGIGALRVDFRSKRVPGNLFEGTYDVLVAAAFLAEQEKAGSIAVVGHSFGGAVAIRAAALDDRIRAVIGLASQSLGADDAGALAPRPLLLVHGAADDRMPPRSSQMIYQWAREPKELILLEGAKHSLRQRREELRQLLARWLTEKLAEAQE